MLSRKLFSLLLVGLVGVSGCVTEVERGDVRVASVNNDSDVPRVSRESELKSKVEADPKDAKAWFELGDYYEKSLAYGMAAECYERGSSLMDGTRFTGGHYTLAKIYMRMEDFPRAIVNLDRLAALEPRDPKAACINPHFREGHYLRGAIYFIGAQWRPARKEFQRFLELGGEEWRVSERLEQLEGRGD
jgi:tetratricopeptide (TPR) repeat protein